MSLIKTEAWVLHEGLAGAPTVTAELQREEFSFPDIKPDEVLAEPIYGCWEGNMGHAIERKPVDICRQRGESKVVLGNAGVVRITKIGAAVTTVKEGDFALFVAIGTSDQFGYMIKVVGYDAPHTMGVLAKQIKLHQHQVIALPSHSRHSLQQWAGFSLRYLTAWANWKLAYDCWRLQMPEDDFPLPYAWGWGGGVAFAQLQLAKMGGAHTAMITSNSERTALLLQTGITPVDRRQFSDMEYDEQRYQRDPEYRTAYAKAEKQFIEIVQSLTNGFGVSIFIDNIGQPVLRGTLRALARQGVIATSGWKKGMNLTVNRALECINHHIHVYTHGLQYKQAVTCVQFAEATGWLPPADCPVYAWENVPQLAQDYANGSISSYFPLFEINKI
ncbi:zinc-binding dehydrogenase [Herpetosiphon giganteus]|uniref:zinc-binding dehydrogenase n=1 Tax=Herpetosiphon giganteus TaxID=2029754 RepID=UPI0019588D81|nr:zinc-binding dehydrogenase [Herpetosiphon giganteus]MBM7846732.1 NADPH:quinone reductase-like Zn-dependent oxidoreductase [Herpetosiphon giganteus]